MNKELFFNGKKYLSSKAAAALCGCTNDHISRLSREGKLVSERVGNAWYIELESLTAFMDSMGRLKEGRQKLLSEERKLERDGQQSPSHPVLREPVPSIVADFLERQEKINGILLSRLEGKKLKAVSKAKSTFSFLQSPVLAGVLSLAIISTAYGAYSSGLSDEVLATAKIVPQKAKEIVLATPRTVSHLLSKEGRLELAQAASTVSFGSIAESIARGVHSSVDGLVTLFVREDTTVPDLMLTQSESKEIEEAKEKLLSERVKNDAPAPVIQTATTNTQSTPTQQVVEKVVTIERTISVPVSGVVSEDTFNTRLAALDTRIAQLSLTAESATTQTVTNYQVIAQSNKIDKLGKVTIDSSVFTNGTLDDVTFAGGDINADSLTVDTTTLFVDTTNNRVGVGTTSPYATLSVAGLIAGDTLNLTSTATSTISGHTIFSAIPQYAHTFVSWAAGAGNSNVLDASLVVNTPSATADSNLIGAAVNGAVRFLVDAEGDIFANSITTSGSVSLSTTNISTLTVENNATLGDSLTDITTINGTLIVAGTTTASTIAGNFGVGTTSPYGRLSVSGHPGGTDPLFVISTSTAAYATSTALTIDQNGHLFLSTQATIGERFSVTGSSYFTGLAQFTRASSTEASIYDYLAVGGTATTTIKGDNATSTFAGSLTATNSTLSGLLTAATGYITTSLGIGTTTPSTALAVSGDFRVSNGDNYNALYVDSANRRVGIGTSTPTNLLTLYNASSPALAFSASFGDTNKWVMGIDTADEGKFKIASSTSLSTAARFVIDGNGNVGIGTSTPTDKLHVKGFVRTDTVDWALSSSALGSGINYILDMAVYNGKLYAGTGGSADDGDVYMFDGDTWSLAQDFGSSIEEARGMAVYKGKLYVGNGFNSTNDSNVFTFDGTTWTSIKSFGSPYGYIDTMTVYNDKLYVGLAGTAAGNGVVYSFDGTTWELSYDFGAADDIAAMAVYNGKLYAALASGADDGDVWVFDGSSWAMAKDFGSSIDAVWTLASYNGKLYAGLGDSAGEGDVYSFDGTTWSIAKDFGASIERVPTLATYNGKLYAATGYDAGDGDLWSFDGASWTTVKDFGASVEGIQSMAVYNGKLYAGLGDGVGDDTVWVYSDRLESQLATNPTTAPSFGETVQHFTQKVSVADTLELVGIDKVATTTTNIADAIIYNVSNDPYPDWYEKSTSTKARVMAIVAATTTTGSYIDVYDMTKASLPKITSFWFPDRKITAIDAGMGYLAVATLNFGVHILSWNGQALASTTMYTTATTPALNSNSVNDIIIDYAVDAARDPKTGGPRPTYALTYTANTDTFVGGVIKDDGQYFNTNSGNGEGTDNYVAVTNDMVINTRSTGSDATASVPFSEIVASSYTANNFDIQTGGTPTTISNSGPKSVSFTDELGAYGSASGLNLYRPYVGTDTGPNSTRWLQAAITTTYNTGWQGGDVQSAWLANSVTTDRSYRANTLTQNGTVTSAAASTGTDINAYSGWSSSNYLDRTHDTDFDFGTGSFAISAWFKSSGFNSGHNVIFEYFASSGNAARIYLSLHSTVGANFGVCDSSGCTAGHTSEAQEGVDQPYDDGNWHQVVGVFDGTFKQAFVYVDGVMKKKGGNAAAAMGTVTNSSAATSIGVNIPNGNGFSATRNLPFGGSLALVRTTSTLLSAGQIQYMYDTEKKMFETNAKSLLQQSATGVQAVAVDPVTSEVYVGKSDSLQIFDGLTVKDERLEANNAWTSNDIKSISAYNGSFVLRTANEVYAYTKAVNVRDRLVKEEGPRNKFENLNVSGLLNVTKIGGTFENPVINIDPLGRKVSIGSASTTPDAYLSVIAPENSGGMDLLRLEGASAGDNSAWGVTSAGRFVVKEDGKVGIGTTTPEGAGLHLYGAFGPSNSGSAILLSDVSVIHGMTSEFTENVFGTITSIDASAGGLALRGISDTANVGSVYIDGIFGTSDPNDDVGAVIVRGYKKSGTTFTNLGSDEAVFQILGTNTSNLLVVDNGGIVHIGSHTNSKMTQGLTINQGSSDDEILSLKSSDVAHDGAANGTEADTFAFFKKNSATGGGLNITAVTDSASSEALSLTGYAGTVQDTARSTSATGIVTFWAGYNQVGGTSWADTTNGNDFVWRTVINGGSGATRMILDHEGDIHYDGTTNASAWDYAEYFKAYNNDVSLPIGTIVATKGNKEVGIADGGTYNSSAFGIISNPDEANTLGGGIGDDTSDKLLVGMTGTLEVRVNSEGGDIHTGDYITTSSVAGVGMKANRSGMVVGRAYRDWNGVEETVRVILDTHYYFAPADLAIDSATGNIGIGTTTPQYKLHVVGDVAAQSFVNISTAAEKKDITYLSDTEKEDILTKLADMDIAQYRYRNEADSAPLHLGLIAEEAPQEVLSVTGKGVDIYKLVTFTLAGVQELSLKVTDLEARVAALEARNRGGNSGIGISDILSYFGQTLTSFKHIAVSALTIGSTEIPAGITLYDEATKQPFCVKVVNGQTQTVAGECSSSTTETSTSTPTGGSDGGVVDTEAPVVTIHGNNPATVDLNSTYNDLGVTVTDNINDNLGHIITVDGATTTSVAIDTSIAAQHSITYTATDAAGNSTTVTRIVIVGTPTEEPTEGEGVDAPTEPVVEEEPSTEGEPAPEGGETTTP